jgi:hypothetical protein
MSNRKQKVVLSAISSTGIWIAHEFFQNQFEVVGLLTRKISEYAPNSLVGKI